MTALASPDLISKTALITLLCLPANIRAEHLNFGLVARARWLNRPGNREGPSG